MDYAFIYDLLFYGLIQSLAIILLFFGGLFSTSSFILSILNLTYFTYSIYTRGVIEYSSYLYLDLTNTSYVVFLLLLSLLLSLSFLFSEQKKRFQFPVLNLLPPVGVVALASYRFDLLYMTWMIATVVLVLALAKDRRSSAKNISISIFIKAFFCLNILLLSIGFYVFGTSDFSLVGFTIENHQYMLVFFLLFIAVGLFWLSIFPFNSWLLNTSHGAGTEQYIFILIWILLPYGLKFILMISEMLPYLEYRYQQSVIFLVSFFAVVSLFYSSFLSMRLKGMREILTMVLVGLNSSVVIYSLLDPVYISQTNMTYIFIYQLLLVCSVLYIITPLTSYRGRYPSVETMKGLFSTRPFYASFLSFAFLCLLGAPFSGLFFSRINYFRDLITEGFILELSLIVFGLSLLSIGIIRPIVKIFSRPDSQKNIIAWKYLDFHQISFRVIFLVGVLLLGIIPELVLKNL